MARRCAGAVTVLAALVGASAAHGQLVVGGTIDLGQPSSDRSVVAPKSHSAAVALLPGHPAIAAVGEPRRRAWTGRIRILQLAGADANVIGRSAVAGPHRGARAGVSLATLDPGLSGDDADLVIGAPRARIDGRRRPGAVFVVTDPAGTSRLRAGGRDVVTIIGAADADRTGAAVAAMPDFDGDGHAEILVGAPGADAPGRDQAGAAYVIASRGLQEGDTVDLRREAALRIAGPSDHARAGAAVAGSLDSNGDGLGEAVVGAPRWSDGAGAVFVVRAIPGQVVDLAAPDGRVLSLLGTGAERTGAAIATPRDLDGDGVRELVVGAPRALVEGRRRAGAVYVARPDGFAGSVDLAQVATRIDGEAHGDRAGSSVAQAGDAAGDANPDLLIGAPGSDALGRLSAGAVYVVPGPMTATDADLAVLDQDGVRLVGQDDGAVAGAAVAGDLDVDRDGRDDVLIGVRANDKRKPTVVATLLQHRPPPRRLPDADRGCDAPTSVVLDASAPLYKADLDERLRASAVELLLEDPSARDRRLGGVEAAEDPAQAFRPLVPRSDHAVDIAEDLVAESVQRSADVGDLGAAVGLAEDLNPGMQSALVIAGLSTPASPALADGVPTDVIGVRLAGVSRDDSDLRALAADSGGRYRRVTLSELQAQTALFDALRRCKDPVRPVINGDVRRNPERVSTLATPVGPGYDFVARAKVDGEMASFADVVLSWDSDDLNVQPYQVSVWGDDEPKTTFTSAEIQAAIDGAAVKSNKIRLLAGAGQTFLALRLVPPAPGEYARTARKHYWRIHVRAGSHRHAVGAAAPTGRLYAQFFQRAER